MTTAELFLAGCIWFSLSVLCLALLLATFRVLAGPTLPDRILALDMQVAIAIGFIAVIGIRTGSAFNLDIAISLGLVGFLATVAFARFVMASGRAGESPGDTPESGDTGRVP